METTTQKTENQNIDVLKVQVMNQIVARHPQLDTNDQKALFQAVYDDYDENDVLHELYDELVGKVEAMAADKEKQEMEYESNLEQTIGDIEAMKGQEGADADSIDQAVAWLQRVADEMSRGQLLKDDILTVMKAMTYDSDVAAADHDGEVRGRNYVITEHLRKEQAPADVHALRGTGGIYSSSLDPLALGALAGTARPTIWERGREKRY